MCLNHLVSNRVNLAMNLVTLFYIKLAFADASPKDSLGDLQTLIWNTQFLGREVPGFLLLPKFTAMRDTVHETDKTFLKFQEFEHSLESLSK